MASKSTAAESIRRLAVQYQQMVEAADLLDQIGSLENATKEAEKARADAVAEAEAAKADTAKAKDEAKKAKDKVAAIIAEAEGKALEIVQAAEIKGQEVVASAVARADAAVSKAAVDVADATAGVASRVAELTTTKLRLEQDVASLQNAISAKQAEAEGIEARLAKAQAQVAKLLG